MKKPGRLRLLLSRRIVASILLLSFLVWAAVVSAKGPEVRTNDSMGIADPHLKADMLRILDSLRNTPDGDRMALDQLRERFSQENVQLGLVEAEKAIMTVQRYRPPDKEERPVDTAGLLIALGDTNAITKAVQSMLTGQPSEAKRARLALARSGQAKVVPELVDPLFRDENVLPERRGEDVFVTRESVNATYIIMDILCQSAQFPPAVTSWAQECRRVTVDKRRSLLREWWKLNEEGMRAYRFGDTLPLPNSESSMQGE